MTSYDELNSASPDNKTYEIQCLYFMKKQYFPSPAVYLFIISVVGKPFHYEIIDSIKSGLLIRSILYGHGYQCNVGVGGLHHVLGGGVLRNSMVGTVG